MRTHARDSPVYGRRAVLGQLVAAPPSTQSSADAAALRCVAWRLAAAPARTGHKGLDATRRVSVRVHCALASVRLRSSPVRRHLRSHSF